MTARRRHSHSLFVPLACLAVLPAIACRDGAVLGPDAARRGAEQVVANNDNSRPVPFRGTLIGQLLPDPNRPAGCALFFQAVQKGQLTHLGRFTGTGTMCATTVQVVTDPPANPGGGPPPYVVADFVIELSYASANGDELRLAGGGLLVESLADGKRGLIGTGTVAGGTGRFAGASGAFDVVGVPSGVTYEGWIVYDASRRSH